MFVRMCPYLPFSARVCLNQHHWLANRMREEGIRFQQCANAFLKCAAPKRLQELADSLTAHDLVTGAQKWLVRLTPFFTRREREYAEDRFSAPVVAGQDDSARRMAATQRSMSASSL